tara:strand:+ start:326 stop:949 length:624 start_codon:yes stop_codon:yes gene_type:complete
VQSELFKSEQLKIEPTVHDFGNGVVTEYAQFVDPAKADKYLKQLWCDCPWTKDTIRIAGKTIPIPRLQCWMGDPGAIYAYSGISLARNDWSEVVFKIKTLAEKLTSEKLNSVLINCYRDGQDSVSWHADDEEELGPDPEIVSFSFGAQRKLQIKPKDKLDKRRFTFDLNHGSVIIMSNGFQKHWLHQVPKEPTIESLRINLTFRHVY